MIEKNPYLSPEQVSEKPRRKSSLMRPLIIGLAILAGIFILSLLLIPTRRGGAPAARRNFCSYKARQIMLAVLNYESANGTLPPLYTVDEDGNRLHSWRTLILPYIEEQALYESIDLSKPWDDPVNQAARETSLSPFVCPNSLHEETQTTYLAIAGPNSCLTDRPRTLSDVKSDKSETLVFVDAPPEKAVHWMSPEDVTEEEFVQFSEETQMHHRGTIVAAFLDGSAVGIPLSLDSDARRALVNTASAVPSEAESSDSE